MGILELELAWDSSYFPNVLMDELCHILKMW